MAQTSSRKNALRRSTAREKGKGVADDKSSRGADRPKKPNTATTQPTTLAVRTIPITSFRASWVRLAIKIRGTATPRATNRRTNGAPVSSIGIYLFSAASFLHFFQHLSNAHKLVVKNLLSHVE